MIENHSSSTNLWYEHFRDIFLEKHWRTIVSRSVCDHFFDAQTKASTPEDVPPIITANKNCLINIYREKIYLVAVTQMEGENWRLTNDHASKVTLLFPISVQPLFVIEFMHRVMDTFTEYFDECTEAAIKDNIIVVYQVRYSLSCSVQCSMFNVQIILTDHVKISTQHKKMKSIDLHGLNAAHITAKAKHTNTSIHWHRAPACRVLQ